MRGKRPDGQVHQSSSIVGHLFRAVRIATLSATKFWRGSILPHRLTVESDTSLRSIAAAGLVHWSETVSACQPRPA